MRSVPINVARGEPFALPFVIAFDGFDFTGVTVVAQVRETVEAGVLATPTVTVTATGTGELAGTLTMTGEQTEVLPDRCVLAVQASRSSPAWGPHTAPTATLNVETPGVR